MRAHVLQHVPFEGLGSIAPWLAAAGATITTTRFFRHERLPAPQDMDFLVILGGPMSVNDEAELPWLRTEKRFIRDAIARGTPVLGVCLGAQLIASSLGARVYANAQKEIGWFPITGAAAAGCFHLPAQLVVFHWHGETFDLPPGATALASSPACSNQAFQLGRHVLALQFHLETTRHGARELVGHCRQELVPGPYVQAEADILGQLDSSYATINAVMEEVLSYLAPAQGGR
jgi:GMP synthase-like glutamine amidotransferase